MQTHADLALKKFLTGPEGRTQARVGRTLSHTLPHAPLVPPSLSWARLWSQRVSAGERLRLGGWGWNYRREG